MRNLVIQRISEHIRLYTDLMTMLDITPDELENLSNSDLLDLLEEITEILSLDVSDVELIKYRDAQMDAYTYFWINKNNQVVSPYYDSESEAKQWNILAGESHHSDKGYEESTHEKQAEFAKKRNYNYE